MRSSGKKGHPKISTLISVFQRNGHISSLVIGYLLGIVCSFLLLPSAKTNGFPSLTNEANVPNTILEWYENAYREYQEDIEYTHKMAAEYAARKVGGSETVLDKCPDLLVRSEAETLYMLIRERKPAFVLEIGPDCGYTTFWILQALEDNEKGDLYSFDSDTQLKEFMSERDPVRGMHRLHFVLGDVERTIRTVVNQWDIVVINSPGDNAFAVWYTTELLPTLKPRTPVMVTNIYNPLKIPEFAPCINEAHGGPAVTLQTVQEYTRCITSKVEDIRGTDKALGVFSASQPSGGGVALLTYMGSCNCATSVYTLSPFKDLYFAQSFQEMRARVLNDAKEHTLNSPSIFFLHTTTTFD